MVLFTVQHVILEECVSNSCEKQETIHHFVDLTATETMKDVGATLGDCGQPEVDNQDEADLCSQPHAWLKDLYILQH